jgi:hypothetical protein
MSAMNGGSKQGLNKGDSSMSQSIKDGIQKKLIDNGASPSKVGTAGTGLG